jgi:Secretion system C-terminal sorting domain
MKNIIIVLTLLISVTTLGQVQTKRVLFLGNSYTYVNNLPQLIADVANSTGDVLIHDNNTPGGFSIGNHLYSTASLNKIMLGNWDYVVLQGQSFEFTTPTPEIISPFPYARKLDSIINAYNAPCGETMLYMTWGRKNGDTSSCPNPLLCTYEGMDSIIHVNYMKLSDTINAVVSPVSAVWKYIRYHYPSIELYQADESHPSLAGSYAAACCFYTALFRKDPTLITFNSLLSTTDANIIKNATKLMVYDSLLNWHIGEYDSLFGATCLAATIPEETNEEARMLYPNPGTSTLTITLPDSQRNKQMQIYNAIGILIKEIELSPANQINIADLPNGIYFIYLKEYKQQPFKFVKQ